MILFIKRTIKFLLIQIINLYYGLLFRVQGIFHQKEGSLLIYTDSRGFLVNCILCNKTPYKSYAEKLSKKYRIYYKICPYKHTTILDFLDFVNNKNLKKYSSIVIHLGIVDFSPRPLSQLKLVFNKKLAIAKKIFPNLEMRPNYYEYIYEKEKTFSLYNLSVLQKILERMGKVSEETKIIWLGVNAVDLKWNGNYFKKRPSNINIILEYQNYIEKFFLENLFNIKYINIDKAPGFKLKEHTVDNMHLSESGFNFFYKLILSSLNNK